MLDKEKAQGYSLGRAVTPYPGDPDLLLYVRGDEAREAINDLPIVFSYAATPPAGSIGLTAAGSVPDFPRGQAIQWDARPGYAQGRVVSPFGDFFQGEPEITIEFFVHVTAAERFQGQGSDAELFLIGGLVNGAAGNSWLINSYSWGLALTGFDTRGLTFIDRGSAYTRAIYPESTDMVGVTHHVVLQRTINPNNPSQRILNIGVDGYKLNVSDALAPTDVFGSAGFDTLVIGQPSNGGGCAGLIGEIRVWRGTRYPALTTGLNATLGGGVLYSPPTRSLVIPGEAVAVGSGGLTFTAAAERPAERSINGGQFDLWTRASRGSRTVYAAEDLVLSGTISETSIPLWLPPTGDFSPWELVSQTLADEVALGDGRRAWTLDAVLDGASKWRPTLGVAANVIIAEKAPETYDPLPPPGWFLPGEVSAAVALDAECLKLDASVAGRSLLAGFLVPSGEGPACPVDEPLPARLSATVRVEPEHVGTGDFSVTVPVGSTSDKFTLIVESVGDYPMTLTGVDWTGWFYNNTRRI